MAYNGLQSFIDRLVQNGELITFSAPVNPELEITEITDRISKFQEGGKALLFTNNGTRFPLLINALGSEKRMALAFGRENLSSVEEEIFSLFHRLTTPKGNLWEKLRLLPDLREVSSWMPKRVSGRGKCQEVRMDPPDLGQLPVLKCWPADGGRFITLPSVHTVDPETGSPNAGMYRMQVFGPTLTGMHWHRHKTGASHFLKYQAAGKIMPVTVTLGGDPVYTYAATAPMPENMDEYLLAGFLRKKQVRLVKCLTNALYVPEDADFVIEGFVDPSEELILEGPFGDHTGFYSLADRYPRFHVTCITHRKDAVYPATIVGIPPMEDAWIGKATERIFLAPIRLTMIPELTDMDLPFAGVAHNISIVKIRKTYPGQALKVMNALWGAGQMMFNKILVVVDDCQEPRQNTPHTAESTPVAELPVTGKQKPATNHIADIHDYEVLARIFRDNFDPGYSLHFSKGPLDILDHSSANFAFGSKLGIDLTRLLPGENGSEKILQDYTNPVTSLFYAGMEAPIPFVKGMKNLLAESALPVLLLSVAKDESFSKHTLLEGLVKTPGLDSFSVVLFYDEGADLNDLFSLVWLFGGNLEPARDITVLETREGSRVVVVDATIKTQVHDHFQREWPNVVTMNDETMASIDRKWPELGLGELIPSPSIRYKPLVWGNGAVRDQQV